MKQMISVSTNNVNENVSNSVFQGQGELMRGRVDVIKCVLVSLQPKA